MANPTQIGQFSVNSTSARSAKLNCEFLKHKDKKPAINESIHTNVRVGGW